MNKKIKVSKVLIIDDDKSILDSISLILNESGYRSETLIKGEEMFKRLNKFKPDIVLLDVLLSGKNGRDICKKLKYDKKTKNIPIIIISAHPGGEKEALECGADDFLAKPFGVHELLNKIKNQLN